MYIASETVWFLIGGGFCSVFWLGLGVILYRAGKRIKQGAGK